jgi:tetratricopeptide (TPR) repeat protein
VSVSKVATRQTADQVGEELSIAVTLNAVYPVLRKYYDTAPVGTVTLSNTSGGDLTDIEITLNLSKYIDRARTYDTIVSLPAGESTTVDLTLLFNSDVLDITEGDRLDATVTVTYEGTAGSQEESATETMIFYDRNAIRWDDTRRVAAFVTERDEEIRSFARRAIAGTRDERNEAVDEALQDAMVIFTAMVESDLMYFRDPSSSYASASSSGTTIDYLQFPRQTLTDFGGDCDDLSVSYNALLESVGRRTAFITVPGHILPAVALQMSADEARSAFMDPTDLVFDSAGTVWVPVEITALEDSFYEAWQEGAKTYRQYSGSGQAEIISTASAWEVFESVESVVDDEIDQPDTDDVAQVFADDLAEFVNTQIATREIQLQADLVDRPGDRRLLNRLGVLYAQYGLWDKARTQFETIVETEEYIPALLNLGHIEFLDEDYRLASSYYDRVLRIQSDHPGGLLAAARANHELENYGNVRTYYEELRGLSPRLAADYSYLDLTSSNDAARAQAASQLRSRVLWQADDEEDSEG